jgi:hypothetical protein
MAIKYTKCLENRQNGHKIYEHLPLQDPPKISQIGIFGLKIYITSGKPDPDAKQRLLKRPHRMLRLAKRNE